MAAKGSNDKREKAIRLASRIFAGLLLLLVLAIAFGPYFAQRASTIPESQLSQAMRDRNVTEAVFDREGDRLTVKLKGDKYKQYVNYKDGHEELLYEQLIASGAKVETEGPSIFSPLKSVFWFFFGLFVFLLLLGWILKQKEDRDKNRVDAGDVERPKVTFADVQGIPEVVERSKEIVSQLRNPERFTALGAKMPKGMILYGPPGSGKTHVARAIAGEAGVPFFHQTGSRLLNKWLGGSAEKIEALYKAAREAAKKHGGAIVFIDEADAIAAHRSGGMGSGNDGRNAALNQLLSELDGFEDSNVVTIVATNRLDVLDEAFVRPGRFDIQLYVGAPDVRGREAILRVYAEKLPKLSKDVDFRSIARQMIGAVGAEMSQLVKEATLVAVRCGAAEVTMAHFCEAIEIVQAGPERKGDPMGDEERRMTAFHEAGHTIAALFQPGATPPTRVTIVPRGQSGGHTRMTPDEDRSYTKKKEAFAQLVVAMAGLAAEKIFFKGEDFTTGPSSDRQSATTWALRMTCLWGMGQYNTYIPLETWMQSPHAAQVEREVEELLDDAESQAIELLLKHQIPFDALVQQLLEHESVDDNGLRPLREMRELNGPELDSAKKQYQKVIASVRSATLDTRVNGALAHLNRIS